MTEFTILFRTAIGALLVANLPLSRMLGVCPLAAPLSVRSALVLSGATGFVMVIAGIASWLVNALVLEPTQTTYLQMFVFILIAASLVQLVETAFEQFFPTMYHALGVQLPLLAANCAIAGLMLLNVSINPYSGEPFTLAQSAVQSIAAAAGIALALTMTAGIRDRIDWSRVPAPFRGIAGAFLIAGILSLIFTQFAGIDTFGLHR